METATLTDFERAIGRLSIRWAIAEHALDRAVAVLHHAYGGDGKSTELPLNAKAKIKFFRKAGNRCFPEAGDFSNEIATEALRLLEERNWCIHGTSMRFTTDAVALPIELKRLARPDMLSEEAKTVTIEHINKTADDCGYLAVVMCLYQCRPLGAIEEDHVYDVFRRFGIEPPF